MVEMRSPSECRNALLAYSIYMSPMRQYYNKMTTHSTPVHLGYLLSRRAENETEPTACNYARNPERQSIMYDIFKTYLYLLD
jgi:hypothetical protein